MKQQVEIWNLKTDQTLRKFNNVEFSSIPFIDSNITYKSINIICELLKSKNADVDGNSSLQIHYDAKIFNDDIKSLINFYKMWSIYENIIYRYSYGPTFRIRKTLDRYSGMVSQVFYDANTRGVLPNNYDVQFDNGQIRKDLLNYS